MSVMATRIINRLKKSQQMCDHLRLTMKQLVTLFNFSNRIATNITKLLPRIPATAMNIQAIAKAILVCNDGPSSKSV